MSCQQQTWFCCHTGIWSPAAYLPVVTLVLPTRQILSSSSKLEYPKGQTPSLSWGSSLDPGFLISVVSVREAQGLVLLPFPEHPAVPVGLGCSLPGQV